ncbi:MAG: hypothetical protein G3M78_13400 [Candidatus Nitrohelix vancouverensis]|uniref:(2Fe-2S) ferredoxin domain-containing protein n=1 Tax=Candidatus Nitrohelix vancouverensis TaxID=2705534 RepID=A0A7T0G4C4_9BACT|nr:MAG: hypothetical protein G3M78_13400 [Candidatus Nitrohelix vancouverensis]
MDTKNKKSVRVCSGAGCKAWASLELLGKLNEVEKDGTLTGCSVTKTKCLKKCGGGISVIHSDCDSILKFRKAEEALDVLVPERMLPRERVSY